jgi:hypothetical protein
MEKRELKAGQSVRQMEQRRRRAIRRQLVFVILILLGLAGLLLAMRAANVPNNIQVVVAAISASFAIFLALAVNRRVDRDSVDVLIAKRGAEGEEAVGALLDELPADQYHVLHDVAIAYGNIDHILISKQKGIFLIETKSHTGSISATDGVLLRDGMPLEKNILGQTTRNVYWLKGYLAAKLGVDVWVNGVIVFSRAFVPYEMPPMNKIAVKNHKFLKQYITEMPNHSKNADLWAMRDRIVQALRDEKAAQAFRLKR